MSEAERKLTMLNRKITRLLGQIQRAERHLRALEDEHDEALARKRQLEAEIAGEPATVSYSPVSDPDGVVRCYLVIQHREVIGQIHRTSDRWTARTLADEYVTMPSDNAPVLFRTRDAAAKAIVDALGKKAKS